MKRSILIFATILLFQTTSCMEKKKYSIFVDASTLLEPNKLERGKLIAQQLPGMSLMPSLAKLGLYITWYLKINPADEATVQHKVFEFYRNIPVDKKYPIIEYQGEILPPIMAAWLTQDLSTLQIQQKFEEYLNQQSFSDKERSFYKALVYGTFDETVTQKTSSLNSNAKEFLKKCLTEYRDNTTCYLIGNLAQRLCPEKEEPFMKELFENRICISGETRLVSPSQEFFAHIKQQFPENPENRIYLISEEPQQRNGEYFEAARQFSHHIHRPFSPALKTLLKGQ